MTSWGVGVRAGKERRTSDYTHLPKRANLSQHTHWIRTNPFESLGSTFRLASGPLLTSLPSISPGSLASSPLAPLHARPT